MNCITGIVSNNTGATYTQAAAIDRVLFIEGNYDEGLVLPLSVMPYLDQIKRVKRRGYSSGDPMHFTDSSIEPKIICLSNIRPSSTSAEAVAAKLKERKAKLEEELNAVNAELS